MLGPPGIRFKALKNARLDTPQFDGTVYVPQWEEFEIDVSAGESLQYLTIPEAYAGCIQVKFEKDADPFPGYFFATTSLGRGLDRCGGYIGDNVGPCKFKLWMANQSFAPVMSACAVAFVKEGELHPQQMPTGERP